MPLERLKRKRFMSKARSLLLERMGRGAGGYMGGPTGGVGMSVGGQPTAGEAGAFAQQKVGRALYGKYGKGGLEREKISSSERVRQMMEAGQTGRRGMMEAGATRRTGMDVGIKQREQDLRYAPGDAFTPIGVNRYKAETERMSPKTAKGMTPKYVSPQYDPITGEELSPAGMIERRQGGYYQVPVQKQGQERPLTIEEQRQWDELRKRQGLR